MKGIKTKILVVTLCLVVSCLVLSAVNENPSEQSSLFTPLSQNEMGMVVGGIDCEVCNDSRTDFALVPTDCNDCIAYYDVNWVSCCIEGTTGNKAGHSWSGNNASIYDAYGEPVDCAYYCTGNSCYSQGCPGDWCIEEFGYDGCVKDSYYGTTPEKICDSEATPYCD